MRRKPTPAGSRVTLIAVVHLGEADPHPHFSLAFERLKVEDVFSGTRSWRQSDLLRAAGGHRRGNQQRGRIVRHHGRLRGRRLDRDEGELDRGLQIFARQNVPEGRRYSLRSCTSARTVGFARAYSPRTRSR